MASLAPRLAGVLVACLAACAQPRPSPASMLESPAPPELLPAPAPEEDAEPAPAWRKILAERVATFGHRNVIAVVDSAYPAHASPAIETIATGASHDEVLAAVLSGLRESRRVRARALVERELELVPEADAPGIDAFRARLQASLTRLPVESMSHDDLVERLGRASTNFRVLVLKTDIELPYTSVFLQLEPGYWSDDAEKRLRASETAAPR